MRPPMIGKTKGVFCMTYAIATSRTRLRLLRGDGNGYEGHTCSDGLRPNFLCYLLDCRTRFLLVVIAQPVTAKYNASLLSCLESLLLLCVSPKLSGSDDIPWCKRHTLRAGHRNYFPFERALEDVPGTLVDHKRRKSVSPCVRISFSDDPSGRVRNALFITILLKHYNKGIKQ